MIERERRRERIEERDVERVTKINETHLQAMESLHDKSNKEREGFCIAKRTLEYIMDNKISRITGKLINWVIN